MAFVDCEHHVLVASLDDLAPFMPLGLAWAARHE